MNDKRLRVLAAIALCLGFAVLDAILLLTAVHVVGTDGGLYYEEQLKADVICDAGICDAAVRTLDDSLARYLRGEKSALTPGNPFNEREMAHMEDCFNLFELLRKVRSRLIPWAIVLILGGAYILRDRQRIRLCAWLAPLILLLPLGLFALYAALNFDAAFTLFHRVLFRNDLWLLDPATDLLIRICPESMFMHMGVRIALYSLGGMLAVSVIAVALTFLWPKSKSGKNAWKSNSGDAAKQFTFGNK